MTWRRDHLPQTAAKLASRPGHETVRVLVADVLRYGLRANLDDMGQEVRAPDIGGRLDTLFGATLFEYKSDLRRERGDVEARLPDYLADRERKIGCRFLGIATDGRAWEAYELRDGKLAPFVSRSISTRRAPPRPWAPPCPSAVGIAPSPVRKGTVYRTLGRQAA